MANPKFVNLPELGRGNHRYPEFWQALNDNPGKWAEYPGSGNVYSVSAQKSRGGIAYEGRVANGKKYVRRAPLLKGAKP